MSKAKREYDIEKRLIDFVVRVIHAAESLPKTRAGSHISPRTGAAAFIGLFPIRREAFFPRVRVPSIPRPTLFYLFGARHSLR